MIQLWMILGAFVGGWVGWAVVAKRKGQSGTVAYAGGFIAGCLMMIPVTWLVGVYDKPPQPMPAPAPVAEIKPQPPARDHNYVMQDGMKYGYPAAISEQARQAGQVAEQLVMALYAGKRDGKHQIHILDGTVVTALECAEPCQYLKVMAYMDNPYMAPQVKVETLAFNPSAVGSLMMEDALRGKLKQYGRKIDGKVYHLWVDEQKGMRTFPVPKG